LAKRLKCKKKGGRTLSGNDYVKFLTKEIVIYLNTTSEEKKKRKSDKREKATSPIIHWFGMIPMSVKILFQHKRNSKE
jgi:hypothetical protein